MTYYFSRLPAPPLYSTCPADLPPSGGTGGHEPLEIAGSDLVGHFGYSITCNDGGQVTVWPCRKCGLMYYQVKTLAERISHEIETEGQLQADFLKARMLPRGAVTTLDVVSSYDHILKGLLEDGTITKETGIENKREVDVYVWTIR